MKTYDKLVRDNVLKILKKSSVGHKYHIAEDDTEFKEKLYKKLQEEIREFKAEPSLEEFADIMQVLESIAKFYNFSLKDIKEVKGKKRIEKGGFDNRIILESTNE